MSRRASVLSTIAVLAAVLAVALIGTRRGMPCHYSYAQDAIAPLRALGFVARYADPPPGLVDKYAPFAYLWFGGASAVALAIRGDAQAEELWRLAREIGPNAWPAQYEPSVWKDREPLADALSDCIVAQQVASALAVVLLALAAAIIAGRFAAPGAAPLAAAAVGLHPYVVYYAHTSNNDAPGWAFLFAAIAALALAWERRAPLLAALAGVLAAAAMGMKDQLAIFLALVPVALLWIEARRRRAGLGLALHWRERWIAAGAFVVAYSFAANWWFGFAGWIAHLRFGTSKEVIAQYAMADLSTLSGAFSVLAYAGTYFVRSAGVAGCALMLAGLWLALTSRRTLGALLLLPALAFVVLYPLRTTHVYPRFVLPSLLPLMILGACAVDAWLRGGSRRARTAGVALAVCLVASLWRGVTVDRVFAHDPREAAARWLAEKVPAGTRVLFSSNHAVPPPRPPPQLPRRWADAPNLPELMASFRPQVLVRVESTYLKPVVVPQFPKRPAQDAPVLATFGYDAYEPSLLHPILQDVDALPVVIILRT